MRIRTAAIGGLVLTLATAGCGSAGEEPVATVEDPLAAVQAASEQTGDITSYRVAVNVDVEESDDPCVDAFGLVMPETEMAFTTSSDEVRMEITDTESGATGRHVDGISYIEVAALPDWNAPTPWVSLGQSDWEAYTGVDLSSFLMLDVGTDDVDDITALQFDEMLDSLELDGLTVTEVGPDEVRGEPATHYRAELEPGTLAGEAFLAADVWVDSDGYVRRMTSSTAPIDFADPGTTEAGDPGVGVPSMTVTVEIWDIGADISIEAPPPGEVTPMSEIDGPADTDSLVPTDLLDACMPELDDLESIDGFPEDLESIDGFPEDLESMMPSDEVLACIEEFADLTVEDPEGTGTIGPDPAEWDEYLACLPPEQAAQAECVVGMFSEVAGTEEPTDTLPESTFPAEECFEL